VAVGQEAPHHGHEGEQVARRAEHRDEHAGSHAAHTPGRSAPAWRSCW
jgi:hypothetical protein